MNTYFKIKKKLDNFTLDMEYEFKKGVLVIQGESGAGKTTILNCISGLVTPEDGRITFGNTVVFDSNANIDIPTKQRNLGYLFQSYALFPNMTVEQNIIYGIKNKLEFKDKVQRKNLINYCDYIMSTFGIAHLKEKYPISISGGEKQRVALSRAIVIRPKLLLLDEPFSALDKETKKIVYSEFELFKKNFEIPTVLITHDRTECEMFADQKIFMKSGKIIC